MSLPRPYYQDDFVTLYHGDCTELLPLLHADLVVTDPPYGINDAPINHDNEPKRIDGRQGRTNTWHPPSTWDGAIDPEWGALCSAAATTIAWFGHWRKRVEVEASIPYTLRCELIWAKDTHVGPPCPAAMRDERIWIFSENGLKPTRFETTVWDQPIIPTFAYRNHKNEKPIKLMTRLISWLPGETVLDPFAGSGTTLRAAKDLGRKGVGIEIDEGHCEIAARRCSQEVLDFGEAA